MAMSNAFGKEHNVRDHRAGTIDQPLQKHAQVRLRVHHIVIRRFLNCQRLLKPSYAIWRSSALVTNFVNWLRCRHVFVDLVVANLINSLRRAHVFVNLVSANLKFRLTSAHVLVDLVAFDHIFCLRRGHVFIDSFAVVFTQEGVS